MKKQKKQIHTFRRPGTVATLAVVGCLVALWALAGNFLLYSQILSFSENNAKNELNAAVDREQLKFCYDNEIKPCDDIAINAFNARPENQASGNQFHSFHY